MNLILISLIVFLGSLGWLYYEPGWEPSLFMLTSFSGLVFSESRIKSIVRGKFRDRLAKKISVSGGLVVTCDKELMKLIRPLCLGENLLFRFVNEDDIELERHAKKKVNDDNTKHHLLIRVQRRKVKLDLCEQGLRKIAELYREGHMQCGIDNLPSIVRKFVSIIYSSAVKSSPEKRSERPFDVYSNSVVKGEISFIADIPDSEVGKIIEVLGIGSVQDMCLPYMYSVLQIPESILYDYIIPAQVFAGLTKFTSIKSNNFWSLHNWAIGPH